MIIDTCTTCDACKPVCPAASIVPNPDFRESEEELRAKYEQLRG